MQCKCGFENAEDAKFCGNCRAALGVVPGSAVPSVAVPSIPAPVPAGGGKAGARRLSPARLAIVAAVVIVVAAGYWWMNRPPGQYKPDNSGLYLIEVNGKSGFMDRSGKTVITPQFDNVRAFSEGLASVKVGTKWGYINTKGAVVITPQFDIGLQFRRGRAAVNLGNLWGFIDKDGKYISSPNFRWVGSSDEDLVPVLTADGVSAFVNRSGKLEMSGKFDGISGFSAGLARARSGGKWGFIDATGKWVIDPQFEGAAKFADGLAPVKVGGRTGYIDQKGKFVVNPQYDTGGEFHDGLALFGSGGKFGFIDATGRVVVEAKFLNAGHFSDGLAPVQDLDYNGWGFIDRTGKMVVSPLFDSADVFENGLARVKALGKEAYITTTGAFVVDPFPGTTVGAERARIAAEAAQAAAKAKAADRLRVEQGVVGEWVGTFEGKNSRLTITRNGGVIGGVLLNNLIREIFRGELRDDNNLILTGISATRVGSSASGTYNLDTLRLVLSADGGSLTGQWHDAAGKTGSVGMKRSRP